jgi:hypothetical protein
MLPPPLKMAMMTGRCDNLMILPLPTSPIIGGTGGNEECSLPQQHENNNYNKKEVIQLRHMV